MRPMTLMAIFANITDMAATLIGTVIAGSQFGALGLVVIGLITPIETARLFISDMFCGVAVYLRNVSISENDKEKGARFIGFALLVTVISGLLMFVGMYFFADIYLSFFELEPDTYAIAYRYIKIFSICPLLEMIDYLLYDFAFRAGTKLFPGVSIAFSTVGFLILALAFVNKYGLLGIAHASVVIYAIDVVVCFIPCILLRSEIHFRFNIKKSEFIELFKHGYTYSQDNFYYALYASIVYMLISRMFGESAMAVFTILEAAIEFTAVFYGVAYAAENHLSIYVGEENHDGIRKTLHASLHYQSYIALAMMLAFIIFAEPIALFFGIETAFVSEAVFAIRIYACSFGFVAFYLFLIDFFNAREKTFASICLGISKTLIAGCGLIALFSFLFGRNGLFIAKALEIPVALIISYCITSRVYKNKNIFLLEDQGESIVSFDYDINEEEMMKAREKIEDVLNARGIDHENVMRAILAFEEVNMLVLEKNYASVYGECTLFFGENRLDMIMRDSGRLIDITDLDTSIGSLRAYIVANIVAKNRNVRHINASNTNRVTFSFPMEEK